MKRSFIATMIAVISVPAVAPSMADDRALFYQGGAVRAAVQMPVVMAGSATIDEALPRIIPSPYRVILDDSVPASLYLIWGNGDNWMAVLNRALAPIGLVAQPDWSRNTVSVIWRKQTAPAQAATATPVLPVGSVHGVAGAPVAPPPVPAKQNGRFEIVRPLEQSPAQPFTPAPVQQSPSAKAALPSEALSPAATPISERSKFVFGITGQLPDPGVMWQLMKAVVGGDRLVLTGASTVKDDEKRVRYSNGYATRLRANLLAVGFPPSSVVVVEHEVNAERSNKPGVKILISRG